MGVKTAYLKQVKGITFAAKSDTNHWTIMDSSPAFGGSGAASSPKELVLMGLAGCTSSDVINILNKKRVNLSDYEVNITAEESDEHPKVFTSIYIEYVFYGNDIQEKDVERAIELSQTKYCSISKMLEKSVNINYTYKIIETEAKEVLN